MALGAIFLAALADKYGRRFNVIISLLIVTLGMFLSAFCESLNQLALARLLTGTGIGVALASVNVLVAEYSPMKRRGLAIGVVQSAYPLGAMLGGVLAAYLLVRSGWQPVFIAGAVGSALTVPVALLFLLESIDFLLLNRPKNALNRINQQLERMGHEKTDRLPDRGDRFAKPGLRGLMTARYRRPTLSLWLAFFMVMFCLYFILSWTPKLLITSGLSTTEGISGGVLLHLGGIVGQLTLGFLAARYQLRKILIAYFGLAMLVMILFSFALENLQLALLSAWFIGFFVLGSITGSYTMTYSLYPTEIRTTALGWAIGVGRIGAIISPLLAGLFLDSGTQASSLYLLFSASMLLGMLAVISLPKQKAD
jgi:MFS family permease